jgi:carbamoyltransferase
MNILGLSGGYHDAAASVISSTGEIIFASHSERYSGNKDDAVLDPILLNTVLDMDITDIAWYERPWLHNIQQLRSGRGNLGPWSIKETVKQNLADNWSRCSDIKLHGFSHHLSHAAAAFQTSPFDSAAVVVIDAVGELDTVSIFKSTYDSAGTARYQLVWRLRYPHSVGLFYTAITRQVGLKPMEEEYITMGMAAYGLPTSSARFIKELAIDDLEKLKFSRNLHIGFDTGEIPFTNQDIAAGGQLLLEQMVENIMKLAKRLTGLNNLAYGGGVALNCVANSKILADHFQKIWIMPSPGDAGSSLGAAALAYGKKIKWHNAYLGYNIQGPYPVESIINCLINNKIAGVASGRAEFGPRALGNRSLLADPRDPEIKNKVNEIKQRQKFRPFAPVILAEFANQYFEMPSGWHTHGYMQAVSKCHRPDLYPAVCHVDGTSRVQTVEQDGSGIRQLLEAWYKKTGCPMLLNTSLNIRGLPMVNNRADADNFQQRYGIPVYS